MREISTNIKKPALVAKRREQILQAALDLFRKQGYHGTSMRMICDKSKVNRASIYDYFKGKADILVFLYKQMMFKEGNFYETDSRLTISDWNDLEPFIKSTFSSSWNMHRNSIQMMYRETISLDSETKQSVLDIESDYVKLIAKNLKNGLGLDTITPDLEILANTIVYFNAFLPLRGWNMHDIKQENILDSVVEMIMGKLEKLRRSNGKE